jgi:hypothetical protein
VQNRSVPKSLGCSKTFPGPSALTSFKDTDHWLSELAQELGRFAGHSIIARYGLMRLPMAAGERLERDRTTNNRIAKNLVVR